MKCEHITLQQGSANLIVHQFSFVYLWLGCGGDRSRRVTQTFPRRAKYAQHISSSKFWVFLTVGFDQKTS